ncbi:MAG TPA: YciI family protein [Acidobacteriaceae bacterium]|nr:YciI family protein [Acidobacteriaceae bacterium]
MPAQPPTQSESHLSVHLDYLDSLVHRGVLRACGPLKGTPVRSALLIFSAQAREEVIEAVSNDPFMIHGQVHEMTITEWDPVFGVFSLEASGKVLP